jgi:hypothetical protein
MAKEFKCIGVEMTSKRTDLPQFTVNSIEQGERDDDGYIAWVLRGKLNRERGIPVDTWCFLLLPEQESLTGTFTLSDENAGIASFVAFERKKPDVVGLTLTQLGSYWRPYQIWMVEDGPDNWSEQVFSASDAILEPFIEPDGTAWRRLAKASTVPAEQSSIRLMTGNGDQVRIVPGGWDHEHCSLCNTHIDPGDRFFHNPAYKEFLCTTCYKQYVPERDIGFVFE